jgi:hypothetical protein
MWLSNVFTPKRIQSLKQYDIFIKRDKSILVKSDYGGFVTLLGVFIMVLVAGYELSAFRSVNIIESIGVDTAREDSLAIAFDISFHQMPCSDVDMHLLDQNNHVIELTEIQEVPIDVSNCYACFQNSQELCCSCDEVKEYYKSHAYIRDNPLTHPLCNDRIYIESKNNTLPRDGCRVTGIMRTTKGTGNFHVAPGTPTMGFSGHTHVMNPFSLMTDLERVKLSHTINFLSFGSLFPSMINPLDGVSFKTDKIVRHIYYIRLVPTLYTDGDLTVRTYQYSVTNHTDSLDLTDPFSMQLPGVWWKFDFSPMLVKLEKREKYFSHLLTRLCAIIGGIWVVFGLVFSTIQQLLENTVQKKKS